VRSGCCTCVLHEVATSSLGLLGFMPGAQMPARGELSAADLPIEATYPARHRLVGLRGLQCAQAGGSHQDHLVIGAATGLMNPRHSSPPGTIALVLFPGEQMPGHAARQLDQRRRPWRLVPRHEPSMRKLSSTRASQLGNGSRLLAASRTRDRLLAEHNQVVQHRLMRKPDFHYAPSEQGAAARDLGVSARQAWLVHAVMCLGCARWAVAAPC
jgi:hypothetical protein